MVAIFVFVPRPINPPPFAPPFDPPGIAGDANLDGTVSLADLTIWGANYGLSGRDWGQADFTGDGQVTLADFTLWAGNYGAGVSGAPAAGVTSPEPSSVLLLCLGTLGLLALKRWHGRGNGTG